MPPSWLMRWALHRKKNRQTEGQLRVRISARKLRKKGIDINQLENVGIITYRNPDYFEITFTIGN